MSQRIEIRISPQGETRLETKGFSGSGCRDASRWLEAALGEKLSDKPTAEYYTSCSAEQRQQAGGST